MECIPMNDLEELSNFNPEEGIAGNNYSQLLEAIAGSSTLQMKPQPRPGDGSTTRRRFADKLNNPLVLMMRKPLFDKGTPVTSPEVPADPLENTEAFEEDSFARLCLVPHNESKLFTPRNIFLKDVVQVSRWIGSLNGGGSFGQTKPGKTNAIFDSIVMSRQHATFWFEPPRHFYLKDLSSSNGTFVNNVKLAAGQTVEIFSGDDIQFGIDVLHPQTNDNHRCIKVVVETILPSGQKGPVRGSRPLPTVAGGVETACEACPDVNANPKDLEKLQSLMEKVKNHEKVMESKLDKMKDVIQQLRMQVKSNWSAMCHEDQLLCKIQCLEEELRTKSEDRKELADTRSRFENNVKRLLKDSSMQKVKAELCTLQAEALADQLEKENNELKKAKSLLLLQGGGNLHVGQQDAETSVPDWGPTSQQPEESDSSPSQESSTPSPPARQVCPQADMARSTRPVGRLFRRLKQQVSALERRQQQLEASLQGQSMLMEKSVMLFSKCFSSTYFCIMLLSTYAIVILAIVLVFGLGLVQQHHRLEYW